MALTLLFLGCLEDTAGSPSRDVPFARSIEMVLAELDFELASALNGPRVKLAINGALISDRLCQSASDIDP